MKNKIPLKILDSDKFFNGSPNTGEPGCECSRCHRHIKEGEKLLRVAVDRELLHTKDQYGKDKEIMTDLVNGFEFRLCSDCIKKAI